MAFVLDASTVLTWAFPDEQTQVADLALERLGTENALAPALWWFEVRNALLAGERRGRLDQAGTATFLLRLARLPIVIDHAPDETTLLALARRYRLTAYDAAYLELAVRTGSMLATTDADLIAAAPHAGVTLLAVT